MTDTTLPGARPRASHATEPGAAAYAIPIVLAAFAVSVGTFLVVIVGRQGWVQPYTLDDPYIHLSVARTIAEGGYGIQPGEIEAPASSILWPFLLAPFAFLSDEAFALVPLVLNIVLGAAVSFQLARLAEDVTPARSAGPAVLAAVAVGLMFAINLPGLVFAGMEHVLQLLATVMIVRELIRVDDGHAPSRSLPWLIALAPLIRYEMLAVAGPAVLLLWFRGYRRAALTGAIATALPLLAFSAFLLGQGLGILPSSVVSKGPGGMQGFADRVAGNLEVFPATFLLVVAASLAGTLLIRGLPRGLPLIAAAAAVAHTAFGRFDGMQRYHPYVVLLVLAAVLLRARQMVERDTTAVRVPPWLWKALASATVLPLGLLVAVLTLLIPGAAQNIHLQQYQMARFAADHFEGPVAVNDLGLVSYLDDDPTVDLWGLGSHDGLEARLAGAEAYRRWIEREVRERGVALAMVYSFWIGAGLPDTWIPLASLTLDHKQVSVGGPVVTFYLTDPAAEETVLGALRSFERQVHPRAGFELRERRP